VTPLKNRAVSGSDEGGSDAARGSDLPKITSRHFPRAPIRRRDLSPRIVMAAEATWKWFWK
jgi:hypothetical protein